MARRDKRYRLPKNWIVLPLIVYSLLFVLTFWIITESVEIFLAYTSSLKAKAETENVVYYADLYDQSTFDSDELFIDYVASEYEFFVADENFNIICKNTDNITAEFILPDEESASIGLVRHLAYELDLTSERDYFFMPDKDCSFLEVEAYKIMPIYAHVPTSFFKNKGELFPYWTVFTVKNGTEFIAFKTHIPITLTDMTYLAVFTTVSILLVFIIFVILIVNLIRTSKNNSQMKKVIFRDNITIDRNWFWFAIKSREILGRRKAGTQYAIVSLVFVKYRQYLLCHSLVQGEQALRVMYRTIKASLEKGEIVAHGNLNTFPILMKAENEETLRQRIADIISRLEATGGEHDFNFQAGIYMIEPTVKKNADIDMLYNNASNARLTLESTDESGIVFFNNQLLEEAKWTNIVTENQKDAIANEEFKIFYQPKYDPRTNELMGAEALVRWDSPKMGFIAPGKFIPLFERSGFITEIDHYMISHVARDLKRWLDEGKNIVTVSVNVSRAHFSEVNLAEQIRDLVDAEGAPHDKIEIELTESAFFDNQKLILSTIKKLKEYGFHVSMDDFGSGYSSLNSLKDMPLDVLKLDAGFFRGEKDNERTEIVVSEALHLARKLNMQTVAEGVDDQYQVDFLAKEGCNMIQGYFYAKPMPREDFELRMSNQQPL